MKGFHRRINFTSATTTMTECVKVWLHRKDKTDYRNMYHEKIKELLQVKYAYSFAGGRMALYCILQALGIGRGDEVIIQGYTCCVVPKAIMYVGAKPIYADITREDYNLSYESVYRKMTDCTKAVIVQHTYGIPCRCMLQIKKLCKAKGIYMIEDCAHTFGIKYDRGFLGTIGDAAFFSTDHTKYISTSVGGVAVTSSDVIGKRLSELYGEVQELAEREKLAVVIQFGLMNVLMNKYLCWLTYKSSRIKSIQKTILNTLQRKKLLYYMNDYANTDFPQYTFPAKLSNIQALIGISQLENLSHNTDYRQQIVQRYREQLSTDFYIPKDCDALLRLPVLVQDPAVIEGVMQNLLKVERWFLPALECIQEKDYPRFYYNKEDCPVAQEIAEHIINLPVHLKISKAEVDEICKRLLCADAAYKEK